MEAAISYQQVERKSPRGDMVTAIVQGDDLWFSQRSLATLFGATVPSMCDNISNTAKRLSLEGSFRDIILQQAEGNRIIRRRIRHVPFEVAHSIAMTASYWDEYQWLLNLAEVCGVKKQVYRVAPVKERNFGEILLGSLSGICEVSRQYRIGKYAVDFYIPAINTAVEFDEDHHKDKCNVIADAERETAIRSMVDGIEFIRVPEGQEIEGLNAVLTRLWKRE